VTWKAMIAGPVQAAQRGVPHVKYLDKVFHIPTSIDREAVTTARRWLFEFDAIRHFLYVY